MAIERLIKSKSFLLGLIVGCILTFGSSSVAVLGSLVESVFDYINSVSPIPELGIFGSVVHSYLVSITIFSSIYFLIKRKFSVGGFKRFSLGFLFAYLIYFTLALVAISQFKFTQ